MSAPRKRYTARDYLAEVICFGGIPTRRIDAINQMRADGATDREIDYWLIGYARSAIGKEFAARQENA